MNFLIKRITVNGLIVLSLFVLGGCGDKEENNAPASKLSASVVTSDSASGHSHTVTVPFTDLASTTTINYSSSSVNGHTHTIALTAGQLADLGTGKRVIVTSSVAVDGHSHNWELRGGNLLYESLCYNCHSNDKRNSSGMGNIPAMQSQRDALVNPASAPLSTAQSATPATTTSTTTTNTTTVSTDGAALYAANCAVCHNPLASSNKRGSSASLISAAIASGKGGMSTPGLNSLTAAQIQAIVTALQ